MKPPIGIGVLSLAHGHVSLYADVMKDFPDVRLLAACDDNPERARPVCERTGMRYESRVEGVLDDPAVQAVMIGSETSRHAALCIAAAEAGKHILLQKPMAMTLEECDRMNASAAAHGVTLAMAWQMRHDPANIKMRDLVQSGALGTIGVVRRRHCIPVLFNAEFINGPTNWHVRAETNIGMFADDAAHPIDWLCWTFGKPVSVMAEIDNVLTHAAPDDNGIALFRLAGGAMATVFNSSTVDAGECTTEIYGDRGMLIQNYGDGPSCSVPGCPEGYALKLFRYDTHAWERFDIPKPANQGERIAAVPRPWVDSLVNNSVPAATGRDGRLALEVVLAAYQSAREGRRIVLAR
ncbi:MAG TPA: Gfo/Idh/MocA family oxidoreductase [Candidatus Hydrogenedentes bacterium]|jgi:predicted dehydrogenase|nr:Gfo/Idh/MocA family oxidoreductase [Candidatus Hydrogenedentota bacterium]MDY0031991.1 Gfo/Idh/MocA family oxidoreductase [FCB group bacterium]NLT60354.1 Gfo/Idh/MocA family oxidoreductase [Candidatus Hydrogenedentota bacterium]HNZ16965.1 Gfo/Idh/MocA family oxidoreductase [Candidatus Hydrogenedentota bacterium]HOH32653.1 Gfo/Idh/MocA family oxidoreductase [Candidatus Hydrogenedentota bacterium]